MASNIFDAVFYHLAGSVEQEPTVKTAHEKLQHTLQLIRDSHGPHGGIYEDLADIELDVIRYSTEAMRAAFLAGMRFTSSTLLVGLAPGGDGK
jgi:hypothetical protein